MTQPFTQATLLRVQHAMQLATQVVHSNPAFPRDETGKLAVSLAPSVVALAALILEEDERQKTRIVVAPPGSNFR